MSSHQEQSSGGGAAVVVIVVVAFILLLVCGGGLVLLGGLFFVGARAVPMPAPAPPTMVQPATMDNEADNPPATVPKDPVPEVGGPPAPAPQP